MRTSHADIIVRKISASSDPLARRRFMKRSQFVCDVEKIVAVQALSRRRAAKEEFKGIRRGVVKLQAVARGRSEAAAFKRTLEKTVAIQSVARGKLARDSYEKSRSAAVKVQSFIRRVVAVREVGARVEERRRVRGAILIQSLVRRATASSVFKEMVREMLHEKKVEACIKVQALIRGKLARDDVYFKHFAATTIQKMWRGSTQQVNFMLMVRVCEERSDDALCKGETSSEYSIRSARATFTNVENATSAHRRFSARSRSRAS